jgi:hypothetical protein
MAGKTQILQPRYISGIDGSNKEKDCTVYIRPSEIEISFGLFGAQYKISWKDIIAINVVGSTDPAFTRVPAAVYGIPGLQSVSTKTVHTGSQALFSITYLGILNVNEKKHYNKPNTARFLAKTNISLLEGVFARYMHIIESNATANESRNKGKSNSSPKITESKIPSSNNQKNVVDPLQELATMFREGLLSKEEFQKAKKKLLD